VTLVHETDVNGVRCFWVETNRPTLRASLIFRQGQADESLAESGWLHLLEHLVLDGKGGGALSINGSVSLLETTFDAHGPADAVAEHLTAVSQWLRDPDLSKFEHERDILAAESASRGGPAVRAFGWRYGARGPGVANLDEAGLGRATAERLEDRAHRVFTRGNAVLVLDGPPPPGLKIDLHDGELLRPKPAVACEDPLPAIYQDDAGLVLSGIVARSPGATLVPYVLERMLRDRLRHDAGGAYAPWSVYQAVDDDNALALAGSDLTTKLLPEIVGEIRRMMHKIKDSGLPQDIVAEAVELRVQALLDPYNAVGLAYAASSYVLSGQSPKTLDQIVEESRAISAISLQKDAWAFANSLMFGVPGEAAFANEYHRLEAPTRQPSAVGRRFRELNWPATVDVLRISNEVIQISGTGYVRTAALADVEGVIAYEDGGRFLISSDGWGVAVEPRQWRNGAEAVRTIDQLVAEDKLLPKPARTQPPATRQLSILARWWAWGRRAWMPMLIIGALAAVAAAFAVAVVIAVPILLVPVGIIAIAVVRGLVTSRRSDAGQVS
jgi:hypothetical protein